MPRPADKINSSASRFAEICLASANDRPTYVSAAVLVRGAELVLRRHDSAIDDRGPRSDVGGSVIAWLPVRLRPVQFVRIKKSLYITDIVANHLRDEYWQHLDDSGS